MKILIDVAPDANELQSTHSIETFLELMMQQVDLMIGEGIIALILLQRFILKHSLKGLHLLNGKNFGTVLIVSFILAMKISRDCVTKNSCIADMFGISISDLNRSEIGFIRVLDHQCWVSEIQFSEQFEKVFNCERFKNTL
ncbi:MAG: hypothetical protein EZS28_036581 [Streblomastix strix]|uniref:Cyclin N-terminal domain-containing protein n=1 Tax=Streblomastix strix TaxID=222440 RepID=A0A5J4UD94_9EUKA|nr:MAG: hypothetical protein EZS28_036581 [Streblomastix strix]